jgi:hypothetical protein
MPMRSFTLARSWRFTAGCSNPDALDVLARSFVEMRLLPQTPDMSTLIPERYLPGAK